MFFEAKVGFARGMFPVVVGNGAQNIRRDTWSIDCHLHLQGDQLILVSLGFPSFSMKDSCPKKPPWSRADWDS